LALLHYIIIFEGERMKYILVNLVSIICIIAAAYTAYLGVDGWGWFLFVGALCAHSWTTSKAEAKSN
jgi:hypothetical protein